MSEINTTYLQPGVYVDVTTISRNVLAILNEVVTQLTKLHLQNETSIIDVRSLPLLPSDYDDLKDVLGIGEISAEIDTIGATDVVETQYHGVWWLTHFDENDEIIAEFIEITSMPEILVTQSDDIGRSIDKLQQALSKIE